MEKLNPELQDHQSDRCLCSTNNKSDLDGRRSGRRLVVAFDGTQNQFGPESRCGILLSYREEGDQLSYYTSGVGTFVKPSSSMRHLRMRIKNKWAAALALNFKSNLLSGYRFLSDKYERGDQIFLPGFSRGAYQVRCNV
ncbi:hypothetical protein EI94DRAFT_1010573 [Lactarius quietus]|nr:hypothetical protein EI94DRAFT_1010573 [Lactarius quietus]